MLLIYHKYMSRILQVWLFETISISFNNELYYALHLSNVFDGHFHLNDLRKKPKTIVPITFPEQLSSMRATWVRKNVKNMSRSHHQYMSSHVYLLQLQIRSARENWITPFEFFLCYYLFFVIDSSNIRLQVVMLLIERHTFS